MSASASATPIRSPALAASASSPTSSWISANRSATCCAPTSAVDTAARRAIASAAALGNAWSGTVDANQLAPGVGGQPAAVLHQETHRAGELVGLLGDDFDGQFLAGQVGTG